MPYTVEHFTAERLFVFRHFGHVTPSEFEGVVRMVTESADDPPAYRVLIDVRPAASYPSQADYLLWLHQRRAPLPPVASVAILTCEAYAEAVAFIALAGQNRGNNIRAFRQEAAAVDWLAAGVGNAPLSATAAAIAAG